MATKLYVGNLPFSTTEEQLKELFAPHGEIASVTIMKDKFTGRSRGFAFVEMVAKEAADAASAALNGTEMDGRKIVVNEARPFEERPPRDRGGYNRYDDRHGDRHGHGHDSRSGYRNYRNQGR